MRRRVMSRRIVAGRGMKMKSRRSAMKTGSRSMDPNRTALYAIIAIVAIVVIVILMRSRNVANVGGEATAPSDLAALGCHQYWVKACQQTECVRPTDACANWCEQRATQRCQSMI